MLRAVFLGTPEFAVPSLHALAGHPDITVPLVVTQPDRRSGRGRALTAPPVKQAALELSIDVIQPQTLRDAEPVERIRAARPDLLVVVAYGEILRRDAREAAPHGCINVHPSLLPRHRGASPIPTAILEGDIMTGVTIIRLERRLDAGPILAQRTCPIEPTDTAGTLAQRLSDIAVDMLPDVAIRYVNGEITPVPQDDSLATYTREWTTADARIDWAQPVDRIERLVRAANPWPVAWTTVGGLRLRVLEAAIADRGTATAEPGTLRVTPHDVLVAAGDGWLRLVTVQPAGKRPMPASDWLRGARDVSERFDTEHASDAK